MANRPPMPPPAGAGAPGPAAGPPPSTPGPGAAPPGPAGMGPEQMAPYDTGTEKWGAQMLRRAYEDHVALMQDYDEMLGVLEDPELHAFFSMRLGEIERFLTQSEKLFEAKYAQDGYPPLSEEMMPDDEMAEEPPPEGEMVESEPPPPEEGEELAEEGAMPPEGDLPPGEDELAEGGPPPKGGVPMPEKMGGAGEGPEDSGDDRAEDEPTGEEAVEGMEVAKRKKEEKKSLPGGRTKAVCTCGRKACKTCMGKKGLDEPCKAGERSDLTGCKPRKESKEFGTYTQTAGFLDEVADAESWDDEMRMKCYHHFKLLDGCMSVQEAREKLAEKGNNVPPSEWVPGAGARGVKTKGDDTGYEQTIGESRFFLKRLSESKDFGTPHKEAARRLAKAIKDMLLDPEADEEEQEEEVEEGMARGEPGSIDEKELAATYAKRQEEIDNLTKTINQLIGI